jgi:hypothetical protein
MYSKQYENIITIDKMPIGPLSQLVSHYSSPRLSPFQSTNQNNCCKYAIRRNYDSSKNMENYFLNADDVPSLLGYLMANGYTIDTSITKTIQKANVSNKKMVCLIHYNA